MMNSTARAAVLTRASLCTRLAARIVGLAWLGVCCLVWGGPVHAATDAVVQVGVKVSPPFVVQQDDGGYGGIAVDLWRMIADRMGVTYEIRPYDLDGLLQAVRDGQVTVAVGSLSVTPERETYLDFTHPYFHTGLAIAAAERQDVSIWSGVVRSLFSWGFLKVVLALGGLLLAVGFLIWLAERKGNPEQFGGSAPSGVFAGLWWAAVTMTTVGYGDKYPKTNLGRWLGLVWMFTGVIAISGFTAAIASSITVGQLTAKVRSAADLPRARVVTVPGSSSAAYLGARNIGYLPVADPAAGFDALRGGSADALVYDEALLQYLLRRDSRGGIALVPKLLLAQNYAFAMPQGDPRLEAVNRALLEAVQGDAWRELLGRELGR